MLTAFLAIATVVCAVGWFRWKLSTMTLLYFIEINRYRFPTDTELKFCTQKVSEKMLSWWPTGKGTR